MPSQHSYEDILKFWFGRVEQTIVPTEHRARIWFGEDKAVDEEIKWRFKSDLAAAIAGELVEWEATPRGQLALIIILDQFSRHIYRTSEKAFAQDAKALNVCLNGLRHESDHHLSLIERVFYYFPLLHSEKLNYQELSIQSYRTLEDLAFAETRVIFDSFLKFANHHFSIIQKFGRFPQRNQWLHRESTAAEKIFIQEIEVRDRE
ncbi:MAG: hypothetical protein A3I77_03030 [Gammaproteobacteria bacterium RIFCSPLOWO2_02_FULL_42_14]|nr:MAG: hypothetical protein A3B71_08135 [Gammaproteobacteria bacterium RIFCSPHIGHO2_02_FULL_42_43]OGT28874.1 MAG: hypothetical protein A2624_05140 [Gammaproteobacteria bacterium RIFCSPHIGHO2_01_FULL_42_8]OGT52382.1 MAG: hypothetical protein A3E54_02010 [Gammaproteobacteria bacterium RIFCSPHIGHO2_12_FULL_41_25]OGT62490.1 MAG: hypothetical protein A3I77_03030 [Gammaproteobacteria bacterium RIFCSPLOWO2_02_FULL_42_14]OGT86294.1 MAG: hypothetical protein A3G86_07145 [Gammaproteobacteria bacterium R